MHIFNIACVTLVVLLLFGSCVFVHELGHFSVAMEPLLFVLFPKNQWWREKVRQILQGHFVSPGAGVWQMNAA
jgi:membrane-associated protease RseP (regulator of RpoE activity)